MAMKLFVGNLSWDTTDNTLRDFFAQAGAVTSASVIMDKFSGRSRGFGFVEMASDDEARKAIETLNGQTLDGRPIVVNEAKPLAPRDNNFRGGGGGFRGGDRGGRRGGFGGGHGRQDRDDRGGRDW